MSALVGLAGVLAGAAIGFGIDRIRRREQPGLSMMAALIAIALGFGAALTASLVAPSAATAKSSLTREDVADNQHLLRLLQQYYPAQAGEVMAGVQAAGGSDEALELSLETTFKTFWTEKGRYLDQSSAEAAAVFWVDASGYLAELDPVGCARLLRGGRLSPAEWRMLPLSIHKQSADMVNKVLVQIATHPAEPVQPLDRREAEGLLLMALAGRDEQYAQRLFMAFTGPTAPTDPVEAKLACEFSGTLMQTAVATPGNRLRRLLAGPPSWN